MIVLSPEEIELITGKKRHLAQCKALEDMNLIYRPRMCDNFPLVSREYFEKQMGVTTKIMKKEFKPNLDALKSVSNA